MITHYGPDLCVDHRESIYGLLVPWHHGNSNGVTHFIHPNLFHSNRGAVITDAVLAYGWDHGLRGVLPQLTQVFALENFHNEIRLKTWRAMRRAGFQTARVQITLDMDA